VNGISHEAAHDALSDVTALIEVTRLIKSAQPQLYEYLLKMRDKKEIQKIVNLDDKRPFVYTSGRYDKEFAKTTVAFPLTSGKNSNVVVYDLRYDPTELVGMSADALQKRLFATWDERQDPAFVKVPVKELQYNRAPAIAPLGVLEQADGWAKISLDLPTIEKHKKILLESPHFAENIRSLFENRPEFKKSTDPEAQLYDGFLADRDRLRVETVRNADERQLADYNPEFVDERLAPLLLHYKARNFPRALNQSEIEVWEQWRSARIKAQLPVFSASLAKLSTQDLDEKKQYILQELQLWAESIIPVED
jgi:exodeoxyribonuclease-1